MRYDFVSLKIFVTIAECQNLTRAAEREHLAVSAVSKRVAELEAAVGTPLLQRQPRGVALTPAGQSLLHYARRVMQLLGQLDSELSEYAGGVKGRLRIRAVASALIQFLPRDIETFFQQYPLIELDIEEATGKGVVAAVADGSADLGVVAAYTPTAGLTSHLYRTDRLVLGVPPGHPLAGRASVGFDEAALHPFVGPHTDSSLSNLMNRAARVHGVSLVQRVRASSFDAMCRMVEAGLGIVLLPEGVLAPHGEHGRLTLVPVDAPWTQRTLNVVVRDAEQLDPLSAAFVDHLKLCSALGSVAARP